MKALKIVGIGLAALVGIVVVVGLLLPRQWQVETTYVTSASADAVFPLVTDLKRWPEWAAWNKEMDPDVKWTYAGPEFGVGAKWSWEGPVMGKGAMTITKADRSSGVWIDEAIEAEEINAHGSITWTVEGDQLRLTWKDEGKLPPVVGGYFKGMIEKMLTEHFSKGLEKLAKAAEAAPVPARAEAPASAPTGTVVPANGAAPTDTVVPANGAASGEAVPAANQAPVLVQ